MGDTEQGMGSSARLRALKEALNVLKGFILGHTTLTTSKEESEAPAAHSSLASRLQLLVIFVLTDVST